MKLNERIKYLQDALGYSQEQFAREAKISFRLLGNWYYRGSNPSGDALEKIASNIRAVNPSWILLEEGPPLLLKKVWRFEDDVRLRFDYKEMVYLFEQAHSRELIPGFYKILGAENWREQLELDLGRLVAWPMKIMSWLFHSVNLPFVTEYYAVMLWRIISRITSGVPVEAADAYALCKINGIDIKELLAVTSVELPENADNLESLLKSLGSRTRRSFKFYKLDEISETTPTNPLWIGIKRAYQQTMSAMKRKEMPAFCCVHNRLFWFKCPVCSDMDHLYEQLKPESPEDLGQKDMEQVEQMTEEDVGRLIDYVCLEAGGLGIGKQKIVKMVNEAWKKVESGKRKG